MLATCGVILMVTLVALPESLLASGPRASDLTTSQTITVTTDDDSVHIFVAVEPWAQDFIKGTRVDGSVQFLPAHRIRSIRSVGDVTDRVLVDHQEVGLEPASRPPIKRNKTITFRGYPYPETKWFFIAHPGVLVRISGANNPDYVFLDWGLMRNLGPRWAVGANIHSRLDAEVQHGFMLRGRRWWNRSISTDLAAGFQDSGPFATAWLAQAHLNLGNVATFTLEMQRWSYDYSEYYYYTPSPELPGSEIQWNAGGSIGYVPGLIALGIATLAAIIITLSVYE